MEGDEEYFIVEDLGVIKGECKDFISKSETQWRVFEQYEAPPFQKIAKYMRNVEYCEQNVRTFQVLKRSLSYLVRTFLPKLLLQPLTQKQRYTLSIFLQERLKAIRCEMFVQGIIAPRYLLKIVHLSIIVQISKQTEEVRNQLIGIEYLIDSRHREIMRRRFYGEYVQALQIAVLTINRLEIHSLIANHQMILEEGELKRCLGLRLQIEQRNFECVFRSFQKVSPLVQCLLWRRMAGMKEAFVSMLKKAYKQVPSSWLYPRIGIKVAQNSQIWINVKEYNFDSINWTYQGLALWANGNSISEWIAG